MSSRAELFSLLRKDKRMKRMKEMREKGTFAIDTEKFINELETMHEARKMRRLKASSFLQDTQKNVIEVTLENTAYRSRSVEIMMRVFRAKMLLEKYIGDMKNYLSFKYNDQLKTTFGTVDARNKALSHLLSDYTDLLGELNVVQELSKLITDDIDKAGFAVKAINDVMTLSIKGSH